MENEKGPGITAPESDYFSLLIENLARSANVHCAWVAEAVPASGLSLRTLAVCMDGKDAAGFEYSIAGTVAQNAFSSPDVVLFPFGVQEQFPDDSVLRRCSASGYAGIPLLDSAGGVVGLLAIASRKTLDDSQLLSPLL